MSTHAAYFLSLLNIILMCVLYPPLWFVVGAATVIAAVGFGIRYAYKNFGQEEVRDTLLGIAAIAIIAILVFLGVVNLSWIICTFDPNDKLACGWAPYTYAIDIVLLMILSYPLAGALAAAFFESLRARN